MDNGDVELVVALEDDFSFDASPVKATVATKGRARSRVRASIRPRRTGVVEECRVKRIRLVRRSATKNKKQIKDGGDSSASSESNRAPDDHVGHQGGLEDASFSTKVVDNVDESVMSSASNASPSVGGSGRRKEFTPRRILFPPFQKQILMADDNSQVEKDDADLFLATRRQSPLSNAKKCNVVLSSSKQGRFQHFFQEQETHTEQSGSSGSSPDSSGEGQELEARFSSEPEEESGSPISVGEESDENECNETSDFYCNDDESDLVIENGNDGLLEKEDHPGVNGADTANGRNDHDDVDATLNGDDLETRSDSNNNRNDHLLHYHRTTKDLEKTKASRLNTEDKNQAM